MESLAQAAGIWLLKAAADPRERRDPASSASTRRSSAGRSRPAISCALEVQLLHRRGGLCRFRGEVRVGRAPRGRGAPPPSGGDPRPPGGRPDRPRVARARCWAPGCGSAPICVVGPAGAARVAARSLESHVVIDGDTTIGERNRFFAVRLDRPRPPGPEVPRGADAGSRSATATCSASSSTVHRGTAGGGGVTRDRLATTCS